MERIARLAAIAVVFALLCACAGQPMAVKARGQAAVGFSYGER